MSTTKPWINWIVTIVLLVAFAMAAAVLLSVTPNLDIFGGSSSTQVPRETEPIVINVPTALPVSPPEVSLPGLKINSETITIEPMMALISLTMFVLGGIVITGIIITLLYTFLDKLRNKTMDSDDYKEEELALSNKEKEYFKEVRQGREAQPAPEEPGMPRWAVVSTSIIILVFVALTGMVISLTFWPQWVEIDEITDTLITPGTAVIGVLCLITLIILVLRMTPEQVEKTDTSASDNQGIPRDMIAVILTGLLIIGLGIGLTIYINLP